VRENDAAEEVCFMLLSRALISIEKMGAKLLLGAQLLLFITAGESAKILFISPNLANSMVLYTGRMADVLVAAGHDVVSAIGFFTFVVSNKNPTYLAHH
jgi:hypothetical protein